MTDYAKKRTQIAKLRGLLDSLSALSAGLPSRDELAKADSSLTELVTFIDSVRNRLRLVPTVDEVESIVQAADALYEILRRAESSPVLSIALGIEASRPPARLRPARHAPIISQDEISARFGDQTIDQLRDTLGDRQSMSLVELRAIASALGARSGARLGRDALVAAVLTKVANLRGYQSLGPSE